MSVKLIIDNNTLGRWFSCLTFPCYRELLEAIEEKNNIVSIGTTVKSKPVALVLAELSEDKKAKLLSIYVEPSYRFQGIATSLLSSLEYQLSKKDCKLIHLIYITRNYNAIAIESLLKKLNWIEPKSRMLVCKAGINLTTAPWMKLSKLPHTYEIFPWEKITVDERNTLRRNEDTWIAKDANPFIHEVNLEPINSLGLRYKGEVVGWMICHRLHHDTIRYTCGYVRPDLQKMGRFIPLLVNAIKLQKESRIFKATWTTAFFHKSFAVFIEKRMKPYLDSIEESRESYKRLCRK